MAALREREDVTASTTNTATLAIEARDVNKLLSNGLLGQAHALGYDAHPKPGTVGSPAKGKDATGPKAVTAPYPHIDAAC